MSTPKTSAPPHLILASTSAYRKLLLSRLGLPFSTESPGVDETPAADELGLALADRLAKEKARAVARRHPGAIVIGSDQVALCEGEVIGKPGSPERALAQLRFQAGKTTVFHTAVCLVRVAASSSAREEIQTTIVSTKVTWRSTQELTAERLARYVALENPVDCAGAAKSEGLGLTLIASMDGPDPTALIGLPLIAVTTMLIAWGLDPLAMNPTTPWSGQG